MIIISSNSNNNNILLHYLFHLFSTLLEIWVLVTRPRAWFALSAASVSIPRIILVQVYLVILKPLSRTTTDSWFITNHLTDFRCFSLPSSNHRAKVFCLPLIICTGTAKIFFCCLFHSIFAITNVVWKSDCLNEQAYGSCDSLPSFILYCIYSSQAWNFQVETTTTVPSINKQYIISGK